MAFDGPATLRHFYGLQLFLEDLLQRPVELVMEQVLRKELRQQWSGCHHHRKGDWRLYSLDMDRAQFEVNHRMKDAVLYHPELIG